MSAKSPEAALEAISEEFLREQRELMAMSEQERFQYIKGIIEGLATVIQEIANTKGKIPKAKIAGEFIAELNSKAPVLLPAIRYTIKDEFWPIYEQLLDRAAGNIG